MEIDWCAVPAPPDLVKSAWRPPRLDGVWRQSGVQPMEEFDARAHTSRPITVMVVWYVTRACCCVVAVHCGEVSSVGHVPVATDTLGWQLYVHVCSRTPGWLLPLVSKRMHPVPPGLHIWLEWMELHWSRGRGRWLVSLCCLQTGPRPVPFIVKVLYDVARGLQWTATIPARELPHFKARGAKDCQAPELELELRKARTEVWWLQCLCTCALPPAPSPCTKALLSPTPLVFFPI
jgi:hypothetical protein